MIMTANTNEEISTIFVVGFPDDMQEREFQNMFIFSPGFEAATLKIPSKDLDDDLSSNIPGLSNGGANPRKQIVNIQIYWIVTRTGSLRLGGDSSYIMNIKIFYIY